MTIKFDRLHKCVDVGDASTFNIGSFVFQFWWYLFSISFLTRSFTLCVRVRVRVYVNVAIVFNQQNFYHKYIDICSFLRPSGFGLILIAIVLFSSNFGVSFDRGKVVSIEMKCAQASIYALRKLNMKISNEAPKKCWASTKFYYACHHVKHLCQHGIKAFIFWTLCRCFVVILFVCLLSLTHTHSLSSYLIKPDAVFEATSCWWIFAPMAKI